MEKFLKIQNIWDMDLQMIGKAIRIPEEGSIKPSVETSFFKHYGPLGFLQCSDALELGIATFDKREFSLQRLEQHSKTQELCFAINGDFVMPVASTKYISGEEYPDEDGIMALHVRTGEGVILNSGVWHGVPFPFGENVRAAVLVLFRKDTVSTDIAFRELKAHYTLVS